MIEDLTGQIVEWRGIDALVTMDQRVGYTGHAISRNLHLQIATGHRDRKATYCGINPSDVAVIPDQQVVRDRNASDVIGWWRDFPESRLPLSRKWL